jgi:phosphopantetheinyl transferase
MLARPGPGLNDREFLSLLELDEGRRYRHAGRYRQWLLGRAAAKALLERHAENIGYEIPSQKAINVHRTPDGWPLPQTLDGRALPVSLTISHTGDRAFCALCPEGEGTVGADIELVAPKSKPLLEDFYTGGERKRLSILPEKAHPRAATLIWCIKEAVLKARRTGFKESATSVEVESFDLLPRRVWRKAEVVQKDGTRPEVWWRLCENDTLAMAIARIPC